MLSLPIPGPCMVKVQISTFTMQTVAWPQTLLFLTFIVESLVCEINHVTLDTT